jgi:DNA repair protein RadC
MEGYLPVYKVALVREKGENYGRILYDTDAAEIAQEYFAGADREVFAVLFLDVKNTVIGISTISIGCLDLTVSHPREVFKAAILVNAAKIILAHNHPSGDPMPSSDDIATAKQVAKAGDVLGIQVLDSIIIGYKKHYSMHAAGLI